jgi:hypothetical protein
MEFRWRFGLRPDLPPPSIVSLKAENPPKVWSDGSLRKQRLFLGAERNLFEQALFSCLLPAVEKESRKVTLECDPRLMPVMVASFPSVEVVSRGSITKEGLVDRDIQLASTLGDLAARFRATETDFSARTKPALIADPTRVAELRQAYKAAAGGH